MRPAVLNAIKFLVEPLAMDDKRCTFNTESIISLNNAFRGIFSI